MADLTIHMFYCHNNKTDMIINVTKEFDTDVYNVVCMLSSTLGIFGAIYQVLPKEELTCQFRSPDFTSYRGRHIVTWLAVADLFASLGVFIRSALWMTFYSIMSTENDTMSIVYCAMSSAWTQYFYMATWVWTLCYAIDMKLFVSERFGRVCWYHLGAWLCPAILTSLGLFVLYFPKTNCYESTTLRTAVLRILPNYCVTYIIMVIVMVVNPLLYLSSTKNLRNAVTYSFAQITGRERKVVQAIQIKFALINLVYYICWLPNLINGILLWTLWFHLPIKVITNLLYIMAVVNPLQAFFNALVYQVSTKGSNNMNAVHTKQEFQEEFSESLPLLISQYDYYTPYMSINGSSSL